MKILIDARLYGLENAGLGRYLVSLVGQLQKIDLNNEYLLLLRKKYFDELKLPNNWQKIKADFRHYSLKEQLILPKLINEHKPDLVHFPHFNVPLLSGRHFVVTIHDTLMHEFKGKTSTTLPLFLYPFKRLGYKVIFSRAVKTSSKIIVPSRWVKRKLIEIYGVNKDKIAVIYQGFNQEIFGRKSVDVKKQFQLKDYFIYVGNAYPHKNLPRAIEAVVRLNKERGERGKIQLALATSRGVFQERLKTEIKKLKGENDVRLLGFVDDRELNSLYQQSIGLIYPSLSEGFGLQGLEAMAAGTVCIMSDIPVFREIYDDRAIFFNPREVADIKKKMAMVLGLSQKQRAVLIEKGREHLKGFSWQTMAKQTLEVYNQEKKS